MYRGENISIPVDITNAALRLPASVQYDISTTTGERPEYIIDNSTTGFLLWDLEVGDVMELDVLIDWDLVDFTVEVCKQSIRLQSQMVCSLEDRAICLAGTNCSILVSCLILFPFCLGSSFLQVFC